MKNNYFILLLLLLLLLIYYISTLFRIHKNTFYEGNEVKTEKQYGFSENGGSVKKNGDKLMGITHAMIADSSKILVDSKVGDYGLLETGVNCDFGEERVPLSMYWDGRSKGENVGLIFQPLEYITNNVNFGDINISSASGVSDTCSKVINVECRKDGVISYKDGYLLDTEIDELKKNGMELETESSQTSPMPEYNYPEQNETPSQDINMDLPESQSLQESEEDPINFGSNTDSGNPPGFLTEILSSLY